MDDYGFFAVLPPLVSLVLAVLTRNVIISLFSGVFVGTTILAGWNPIFGFISFIEDYVFVEVTGKSNSQIIVTMFLIGGFVALIETSGAANSLAKWATKFINGPKKAQIIVWLSGIAIFFTDSGNALILGPIFRPISDKVKVCREKFAYILDSTASPICVLVPFISWGIYAISLIEKEFQKANVSINEFSAFMKAIPFQFYPILALIAVPLFALTNKDFGPMAVAQRKFLEEDLDLIEVKDKKNQKEARLRVILVPLFVLFSSMTILFVYYGVYLDSLTGSKIRTSLATAYLLTAFISCGLLIKEKIMTFDKVLENYFNGMKSMLFVIVILVLAWSLGDVCKAMGTGGYIVEVSRDFLTPAFLPLVIFIMGAICSFATGSSWGTFAILMPIAIPMAIDFDVSVFVVIGSVLSGGLFGDHSSPISDTTVLASMAGGCEHIDHVKTQIPYAAVSGLAAMISFIVAGFTGSNLTIFLAIGLLFTFTFLAQKFWQPKEAINKS